MKGKYNTMNNKNEIYNLLTSLVDEDKQSLNFLRGFDYRDNFLKIYELITEVNETTEGEMEIISGFDTESEDEYINTFRRIVFSYDKDLLESFEEVIESSKKFNNFVVKEINKKKKSSHAIELILNEEIED